MSQVRNGGGAFYIGCPPTPKSEGQMPPRPPRFRRHCNYVLPVTSVRDLGLYIDCDVSLQTHVAATVRSCFAALRQIRSVRRCLPRHALLSLIRALVASKVDYCCSVLAGVSSQLFYRLQSIFNAAARLVNWAIAVSLLTSLMLKNNVAVHVSYILLYCLFYCNMHKSDCANKRVYMCDSWPIGPLYFS